MGEKYRITGVESFIHPLVVPPGEAGAAEVGLSRDAGMRSMARAKIVPRDALFARRIASTLTQYLRERTACVRETEMIFRSACFGSRWIHLTDTPPSVSVLLTRCRMKEPLAASCSQPHRTILSKYQIRFWRTLTFSGDGAGQLTPSLGAR